MRRMANTSKVENAIQKYVHDKKVVSETMERALGPAIYEYLKSITTAWAVLSLSSLAGKLPELTDTREEMLEKTNRFGEHLFYFRRLYGKEKTKTLKKRTDALLDSLHDAKNDRRRIESNRNAVESYLVDLKTVVPTGRSDELEFVYEPYVSKKMYLFEAIVRVVHEKNATFRERTDKSTVEEDRKEAIEIYENLLSVTAQCLFHKIQKTERFFTGDPLVTAMAWLSCQSPDVAFKQFPSFDASKPGPVESTFFSDALYDKWTKTDHPVVVKNYNLLSKRNKKVALNPKKFGEDEERTASTTNLVDYTMRSESIKMANFGFYAPSYDAEKSTKKGEKSRLAAFLTAAFPPRRSFFGRSKTTTTTTTTTPTTTTTTTGTTNADISTSLSPFYNLSSPSLSEMEKIHSPPGSIKTFYDIENLFITTGSSTSEDHASY